MSDEAVEQLRATSQARVGTVLSDKYRLEDLLGFGGTAAVYRAYNVTVERPCAVKVLHGQHRDKSDLVTRFRREALAANRVRFQGRLHPNVVDVLDAGESDGCLYLVTDLLQGENVADYAHRQPEHRVPVQRALELLRPIFHAVAVAHRSGVVHRDIKPDNLFLEDHSHVGLPPLPRILDFGIAQLGDARITLGNSFYGTAGYLPPEGYTDPHLVDARLDVWALGLVLYELLAGYNPFEDDTVPWYALAHRVQTLEPPSLAPLGVPAAVRSMVLRCLKKDRTERFADGAALLEALEHALRPDLTLEVQGGETLEHLRARLDELGPVVNGLRVYTPRSSVGELLAFAELDALPGLRAFSLTESPFESAGGRASGRCVVGDEFAVELGRSPALGRLVSLELSGTSMAAEGGAALGASRYVRSLASLLLSRNRLGDWGLGALLSENFRELEVLDLSHNGVGDDGARALSRCAMLPVLHTLELSGNRITDAGARALLESISLPEHCTIVLTGNPLSAELRESLRAGAGRTILV